MHELLGTLTILFFVLATSFYLLKRVHKFLPKKLKSLSKFVMKNHKLWGFLSLVTVISHGLLSDTSEDEYVLGLIAGGFMIAQVLSGMLIGLAPKNLRKPIKFIHRILVVFVVVLILIHVD